MRKDRIRVSVIRDTAANARLVLLLYKATGCAGTVRSSTVAVAAAPPGQKVSFVELAKFSNGFRRIERCCAIKELVETRQCYAEYDTLSPLYVTLVFQIAHTPLVDEQRGKSENVVPLHR